MVGVAIYDIKSSETVEGVYMDTNQKMKLKVIENVPLGHKVALSDMKKGERVLEYKEPIGQTFKAIKKGEHVHVHNIKSLRWPK